MTFRGASRDIDSSMAVEWMRKGRIGFRDGVGSWQNTSECDTDEQRGAIWAGLSGQGRVGDSPTWTCHLQNQLFGAGRTGFTATVGSFRWRL